MELAVPASTGWIANPRSDVELRFSDFVNFAACQKFGQTFGFMGLMEADYENGPRRRVSEFYSDSASTLA